jgi:hypothetical protein
MKIALGLGVLLVTTRVLLPAQDPREIVRRSTDQDRRNEALIESYTFIERQEERSLDSQGRVKDRKVRTYDITLTEGSPYRRLIARDDRPLSPDEERKEQRKLETSIAERRAESPGQRAKRLAEWREKRERDRAFLREVPDAFDFRMLGEEMVDGRKVYVIEAVPRPGYRPRTSAAKFLPKFKGKLWIDAESYDWVKVEAETIGTVSIGGFLVRLSPGARLTLSQTRVNHEIWLPQQVTVAAQGRILLLKKIATEMDITYSDYKKFRADSRIVSTEEAR